VIAAHPASRLTVVFAGGGTGGHLYPALSVAERIAKLRPDARIVFFGTTRPVDADILSRTLWEFVPQQLTPLSAKPWRWPRIASSFHRLRRDARSRFAELSPSVVLGSGGLASVPPVLEALRAGIPAALFNPDAVPGRANRFLASRVNAVFAQWEATRNFLPSAYVEVTGCPVRREFLCVDRAAACETLGLDKSRSTLLITGASQGARTINEATVANAEFLRRQEGWQILHLTGAAEYAAVRTAYSSLQLDAVVLPYAHNMAGAFAAADVIVSRAGASTLAEIAAVGRASILMPYPYHRDQHQLANAQCLAVNGGAMILRDLMDATSNAASLRTALEALMSDDETRRKMTEAARRNGRRDASETIANRLLSLSGAGAPERFESMEGVLAASR
jgi:UDP-N-acetylglucosamine--N-acetylmuramyl-(pentapeptide) pyrophosphoryl-undecaprenol N-acetylglucosamine transferase